MIEPMHSIDESLGLINNYNFNNLSNQTESNKPKYWNKQK